MTTANLKTCLLIVAIALGYAAQSTAARDAATEPAGMTLASVTQDKNDCRLARIFGGRGV